MASCEKIIDYLQLINSAQVGAITFHKLVKQYGSAATALENLPPCKKSDRGLAEQELAKAEKLGIEIILEDDPEYPSNLRQIDAAPPVLYARGNLDILNMPFSLSIVGARNATISGRKTASRIAYDLTEAGVMISSGMARGIDTAAHKGALYAQNQQGATIAVLGTGADVPYPDENTDLYQQIAGNGVIISEFALGTQPNATNFPRRNRIVAALSQATLVVEATLKSGSLITAQIALEQGRKILAVPGSPTEGRAEGPNRLIKEGASLVENAEDILKILRQLPAVKAVKSPHRKPAQTELFITKAVENLCRDTPVKTKVIDYLNHDGVYVDEIIRASGLDASMVALELLELEMAGQIARLPGNKAALIK